MGLSFFEREKPSPTRLNAKTITWGTGDQIQAMGAALIWPFKVVGITQDSTDDTLIAGLMYYRDKLNQSWRPLSLSKHTHSVDTDAEGGLLTDIFYDNAVIDNTIDARHDRLEDYQRELTGSSDESNRPSGEIRFRTNQTGNSTADLYRCGIKGWFNRHMRLATLAELSGDTTNNLLARMGVASEKVSDVVNTGNKFFIECCDATGTSWQLGCANGSTRSVIGTSFNMYAGAPTSYRLDYEPASGVTLTVNGTTFVTKTSNVPSSGSTGRDNIFRLGVKTTTTNLKTFSLWGMMLVSQINDTFD